MRKLFSIHGIFFTFRERTDHTLVLGGKLIFPFPRPLPLSSGLKGSESPQMKRIGSLALPSPATRRRNKKSLCGMWSLGRAGGKKWARMNGVFLLLPPFLDCPLNLILTLMDWEEPPKEEGKNAGTKE